MLCCELVLGLLKRFAPFHGLYIGPLLATYIGLPCSLVFRSSSLNDFVIDRNAVLVARKTISYSFSNSVQSFHAERSPCRSNLVIVPALSGGRTLAFVSWCQTLLTDEELSVRIQDMSTHHRIPDILTLAFPSAAWWLLSERTPCSVSPLPTSTTTPSSSWLTDGRSRSVELSENRSEAHAARIDE